MRKNVLPSRFVFVGPKGRGLAEFAGIQQEGVERARALLGILVNAATRSKSDISKVCSKWMSALECE